MKNILILTNQIDGLYCFRRELIERLIGDQCNVAISSPQGTRESYFRDLGCKIVETKINCRGTNIIEELTLLKDYLKIIKEIKPDIVFTYTIKPNVYGGLACRVLKVPYITNITGLGVSIENKGFNRMAALMLYKIGLKKVKTVFFQNEANKNYLVQNNIIELSKARLIPGSGVNIKQHTFEEYPADDGKVRFLYLGRIVREKGINELLEAARIIRSSNTNAEFHIVGWKSEVFESNIDELEKEGIVRYHGPQRDVHSFIRDCHAVVNPSFCEGMSNSLLEAASTGRPILASMVPGCIETFDEGISGFGFEVKNTEDLVAALKKFIELTYEEKKKMGIAGRSKMEKEFNRDIVINAYMEEIK
jgi:glycosyltransferase involved in cell wall biosynthesis